MKSAPLNGASAQITKLAGATSTTAATCTITNSSSDATGTIAVSGTAQTTLAANDEITVTLTLPAGAKSDKDGNKVVLKCTNAAGGAWGTETITVTSASGASRVYTVSANIKTT